MIYVTVSLNGVESPINGNGQHIKGTISQEIGAINSFEFEIYPQNIGFDLIQSRKTLVKAINTVTGRVEFAGRVLLAEMKMESNGVISKRVTCESYLGYLYDSVQPFAEEATTTLSAFLQLVLDNHNARVESEKRMQLGTVDVDVAGTGNVTKGLQYETTYDTIKSKLVDIYGGELEVVENEGVLYLNYLKKIGETRATTIELGRNMQAASREVSPLNIITRLIPLGAKIKKTEIDAEGNETEVETGERLTLVGYTPVAGEPAFSVPWIDDEEKQKECGIVCGRLEFDDVTEQSNLYRKTIEYMQNENLVALSHTLTALDLKEIGQDIDGLNCGDSYPVKNPLIGLDEILRITKKTIDINAPYKGTITIGEKRATLTSIQAGTNATIGGLYSEIQTINKVTNNLKEHVSTTEKSVNELTNKVEGIDGTYFYIRYSPYADGHVMTDAPEEDTVYMGTCSTSESTAPKDYTKYTWVKVKGLEGKGVKSITNYYLASSSASGITTSTSGWTEEVQAITAANKYLWNYEKVVYTDESEENTEPCIIGNFAEGKDGNGISKIEEYYAVSTSNTTAPSSWQTTVPKLTETNKYLWNYEKVTYTNNETEETAKRVIGVYGDKGAQGNGVTKITNYYLASASASGVTTSTSGWTEAVQTPTKDKKYLWNYEKVEYSGGLASTITEPCIIGNYAGDGKGISSITEYYLATTSSSGITVNTSGWKTTPQTTTTLAKYLWNYEHVLYTDGSESKTTPVIIGVHGETGKGVSSVKNYYLASASSSGVTTSTSGWTEAVQTPTKDKKYLWNYEKITYTDSSTANTTPCIIGNFAEDGSEGASIDTITEYYAASTSSTTAPADSSFSTSVPTLNATNKYLWNYEKITYTGGKATTYTSKCVIGVFGADGKTQRLHIKYSDDGGQTFTDSDGEELGAWIGTLVDFNEYDSTNPSDYTWKKFTEDVEEELEDIRASVVTLSTDIINNGETLELLAKKDYVETSTFDGYKQTIEEQIASLEIENDEIDLKFESKTTEINNNMETKFTEFYKYFKFTENGLEISSSENAVTLEIDNDMIVFKKNGVQFGWWDGVDFHTGNIVVEVNERAQFGNFAFIPRSSGALSFLKVSESEPEIYVGTQKTLTVEQCSTAGNSDSVPISDYTLIKFTAPETAIYKFATVSTDSTSADGTTTTDTCGRLYDKNKTSILASNDDASSTDRKFSFTYECVKGASYYLAVKFYAMSYSGTIDVLVSA